MLIRKMLWPTIKKKKALSIAMMLVVFIGSVVSTGFSTSYYAFKRNTNEYINNYGYPDATLVTENSFTDSLQDISAEGIEAIKPRSCFYKGTVKGYNPKILKFTSFTKDSFTRFVTLSEANNNSEGLMNIYVDFSFAKNNNISAGSKLKIYDDASESYKNVYVNKIVGNPETIFPMIQYGFQVDKYNFGYAFVDEKEVAKFYPETRYNEIVIKTKTGTDVKTVVDKIKSQLTFKEISIKTTIYKNESYTIQYINNIISYIYTASVVVPIIFSFIAALLLFLFLYQITKSMTKELGTLNALGIKKGSLFGLLVSFSLSITLVGTLCGTICGYGLANLIYNICKYSYSMPLGNANFNLKVIGIVFCVFILISLFASFLTIFSIRKLSPKEAMIDNMDKNKPLPKPIDNFTKKSFSFNFALNTIHKNKVRFIIAIFAVMISAGTSYAAFAFGKSIDNYSNELSERINYDAQVYNLMNSSPEQVKEVLDQQKADGNVTDIERYYVGELKFSFNNTKVETNICAIENNSTLVRIPGNLKVNNGGIILESSFANKVGAKENDIIDVYVADSTIKKVKISGISKICADKYNYMSIETYKDIFGDSYGYSSFLVNYIKRNDLALALLNVGALPLYSKEMIKTYTSGCNLILLTSRICIAISLSIGFITICIMTQASLLEQKRKFSTLRVLGLQNKQVFKISFMEILIYFVIGVIIGLPLGVALNALLIYLTANDKMTLLMFNPWWAFFVAVGLVIISLSINLLVEYNSIKKWDIAKNTKTRE